MLLCHYVTAHVADTSTIGQERQVLMARRRSKAEVEELEDEEELDLEDLDDEADVEDEDVEEEDEDEEEEAPRKSRKKKTTKAKTKAKGTVGTQELAEALDTDGKNLRVMLRDHKVKKNDNNRYEWESIEEALEAMGFEDLDDAREALSESRNKRLDALKERNADKKKATAKKKKAPVDGDGDEDEDEEEDEEPAPRTRKKRTAKK